MIKQLFEDQRPLMAAGAISFAFFLITAVLVFVDPAEILGINRWIKPMKFFVSIAIFLWTMALYFEQLPSRASLLGKLAWVMIAVFVVEMIVITGQSIRMQRSHFNINTPLDGALFAIMGLAILVLTIVTAYIALLYLRSDFELPRSVVWGMRLGLIVMLLGSIQGGYMSSQLGHAVGVPEGRAGLPVVNWSTEGGDLRIAHFLGLHGLQAIPLFALLHERFRPASATIATFIFALIYTAAFTGTFIQALYGRPFFTWM